MSLLALLILIPWAAALALLFVKSDRLRRILVVGVAGLVAVCCVSLAGRSFPNLPTLIPVDPHVINKIMLGVELAMGAYVVYVGISQGRPMIVAFMTAQTALVLWFEMVYGDRLRMEHNLFIDKFSIIMALINGLVGSLICVYALGYMREFHEDHPSELADRRPAFFALLFVFLGAMFGLVFSNNLLWLFFFWEITTLCSFLLIGYTRTEETRQNALRALTINVAGGVLFAAAVVWFYLRTGQLGLDALIAAGPKVALLPAALLSFAGITKSAQFPFTRWLLGAMVAPTPVSALLHSSTMVKAGVYIIIRLAPVMVGTVVGTTVAMVGGVTFLIASFAAMVTQDAKKVLAYSTVANLGLVVLCGGIGTYEAVWAGILLIVFHAVAKCLLFLCVGVIEHKLHSRNLEKMSGLILSMPRVSVMLQVGIAGMFLAPFGMLISKWAVFKAVVDAYPLLTVFIAFGSAANLFFWVKWLGKLIEVIRPVTNVEHGIAPSEWFALYCLSSLTAVTCLFFPVMSSHFVEPYVVEIYGKTATMAPGNLIIMTIMLLMVSLFPLSFFNYGRKVKVMDAYLGGANAGSSILFQGSGNLRSLELNNYYFADFLNEERLFRAGVIIGMGLLLFLLGLVLL